MAAPYVSCSCPFCSYTSKQEKRFYAHLADSHGISNVEECYIQHCLDGASQLCKCGCGMPLAWRGWKLGYTSRYVRGHNAVHESKLKPKVVKEPKPLPPTKPQAVSVPTKRRTAPLRFTDNGKYHEVRSDLLGRLGCLGAELIAPFNGDLTAYFPEHRVGINLIGLYQHSLPVLGSQKHQDELRQAYLSQGIDTVSFFEDEWRDHSRVLEDMIKHRLHMHSHCEDARKCILRELTRQEATEFFNQNHLEGYARCTVSYGLVKDGGVLAAMSLRRPFHRSYADKLELARSCCRRDVNLRGWLGRLTRRIRAHAHEVGKSGLMTYVDSRVGGGGGYSAAGWRMVSESTGARFWWTDGVNRFNRFKYKADKSRGMSQDEVAKEAGVEMIFGFTNSRWET